MRSNLLTAAGVLMILAAILLLTSWEWALLGAGAALVVAGYQAAIEVDERGVADGS